MAGEGDGTSRSRMPSAPCAGTRGPRISLSFDTFCPLGPALVALDELDDPLDLRIRCRVNGTLVQDAATADMIVDVPHLVELLSR